MAEKTGSAPKPRACLRQKLARRGEIVVVSLDGMKPRERLLIEGRAALTSDVVRHVVRVDRRGSIDNALRMPAEPAAEQQWTFSLASLDRDLQAYVGSLSLCSPRKELHH